MPKMVYDFVDIKKIEDIPKDSVIGEWHRPVHIVHQLVSGDGFLLQM